MTTNPSYVPPRFHRGVYSGGSERPTVVLDNFQIIALPHSNTVAVVDFGPVMHRIADTGVPEQDWAHNRFREGIDEYAERHRLTRDQAVRALVEHSLNGMGLPTDKWIEDHQ